MVCPYHTHRSTADLHPSMWIWISCDPAPLQVSLSLPPELISVGVPSSSFSSLLHRFFPFRHILLFPVFSAPKSHEILMFGSKRIERILLHHKAGGSVSSLIEHWDAYRWVLVSIPAGFPVTLGLTQVRYPTKCDLPFLD